MKRFAILISIAALSGLTVAAPVLAAAPANDDIASPTVVGSLPYSDGPYDTTEGMQNLSLSLDVTQRVGRFTIGGIGGLFEEGCPTSPTPWSIELYNNNGKFKGGAAQVDTFAYGCNGLSCASDDASWTVHLRH